MYSHAVYTCIYIVVCEECDRTRVHILQVIQRYEVAISQTMLNSLRQGSITATKASLNKRKWLGTATLGA